jgi:small subunit ribosomal protein S21|tara:strand:- start:67 stop:366 length:300 start_codon:yes stop_codon:yes gene_type:complete
MVTVYVRQGNFYKAFSIFKRKVQKEGILKSLKDKRFYEKPSIKKKRKATEALRRRKKTLRKMQIFQERQENSSRKRKWKSPIKEQLAREKAYYLLKSRK